MSLPDGWKTKSAGELERFVLEQLEKPACDLNDLLKVLEHLAETYDVSQADDLAGMAQEAYAEKGDRGGVLRLLAERIKWPVPGRDELAVCRASVEESFNDRWGKAFVEAVDMSGCLVPAEIVRRLSVLISLHEGTLCNDKTWGFGIVRDIDDFYQRVTIDFETKKRHRMTFAYAAETLELLSDEHLLALNYNAPEKVAALMKDDPAEVVRMALRSFGPLSVPDLQQRLCPALLPDAQWKSFWDRARKDLKKDPLVEVPARRQEPLKLFARALVYDDGWAVETLGRERDVDAVLKLVGEAVDGGLLEAAGADGLRAVGERLGYVVHACDVSQPALAAQALLYASKLNLPDNAFNLVDAVNAQAADKRLRDAVKALPVRDISAFLSLLMEHSASVTAPVLLDMLPCQPFSIMDTIAGILREKGYQNECKERLAGCLGDVAAPALVVDWAWRRYGQTDEWLKLEPADLLLQAVDVMERDLSGEELRAQNDLRSRLESSDTLADMLGLISAGQREALVQRINSARLWDTGSRRSVLARIIKLYPEVQTVLSNEAAEEELPEMQRVTSWRSYRERQEMLRDIVEREIPENSKEIGVARSYGDLRENFEYQAAKDRQRLLMQRQAGLEQDLKEVQGTDFKEVKYDRVVPGVCVVLTNEEGGQPRRLAILGEWDRDERLGVISNKSRIGKALIGQAVGYEVLLPDEHNPDGAEKKMRISAIEPLSDDIRRWISCSAD